jgi:hypothetical protein
MRDLEGERLEQPPLEEDRCPRLGEQQDRRDEAPRAVIPLSVGLHLGQVIVGRGIYRGGPAAGFGDGDTPPQEVGLGVLSLPSPRPSQDRERGVPVPRHEQLTGVVRGGQGRDHRIRVGVLDVDGGVTASVAGEDGEELLAAGLRQAGAIHTKTLKAYVLSFAEAIRSGRIGALPERKGTKPVPLWGSVAITEAEIEAARKGRLVVRQGTFTGAQEATP